MGGEKFIAGLVGGVGGLLLLNRTRRRIRRRRTTSSEDGSTFVSREESFSTTGAGGVPDDEGLSRPPLEPVEENQAEFGESNSKSWPWEQIILLAGLLGCLVVSALKRAWDILAIVSAVLLVLVASMLFKLVLRRRKRRQQAARERAAAHASSNGAASPAAAGPSAVVHYPPDMRLVGIWVKDNQASDPMNTACDIMHLNGVVRLAVSLVRGVEINLKPVPGTGGEAGGPGEAEQGAGTTANGTQAASRGQQARGSAPTTPTARAAAAAADALDEAAAGSAQQYAFEMAVFSVVRWFKVRERYLLNGPSAMHNRRDLRRGKHVGRAVVLPDGGVKLEVEWGTPHGGKGHDELRLESPDELHVTSHLEVAGRKHTYTQVYHRKR